MIAVHTKISCFWVFLWLWP